MKREIPAGLPHAISAMHDKLKGMSPTANLDVWVTLDGKVCGEYEAEKSTHRTLVGRYGKYTDPHTLYDDVVLAWGYLSEAFA